MSTVGSKGVRVGVRRDHHSVGETNHVPIEGRQLVRDLKGITSHHRDASLVANAGMVRRRKQRPKKRYVLTGILLFLFLAGSVSSLIGYLVYNTYIGRYHTDFSLAQTGMQHLQKAEVLLTTWSQKPFDVQYTGQAKHEFASALKTFSLLNEDLKSLPAYVRQVPVYGERLSTALHVVPLAITLSQAGVAGSDILNTLVTGLHDPLTPQGRGITPSDLVVVTQDVKELGSAFVLATREINQLQPVDMQFDPRVSKLVVSFRKDIPMIQGWLDGIEKFLPVAPTLLGVGTPANYLIEVLDSTELRPAGGFIGNYGIATFSGGQLAAARITDVDLLDGPFEAAGHVIPYPTAYSWFDLAPGSWSFRDSNLDADFPTAARYGEQIYIKEGGSVPVQGVIAITPALIEHALVITGSIAVPEYQETVTAQNLIARIHYHQLGGKAAGEGSDRIASSDGHSSLRKRFTELLAEHFLARVRQLPSTELSKLLQLMTNAVRSKDIQLYFNSSIAENLLHRVHFGAAIQSPNGDSLFVVDANIAGNKANDFITYTLKDRVALDEQGNALHHTSISYAWQTNGQIYGSPHYKDYVRVYVPPGSILQMQNGWQSRGTSQAFSHEIWSGVFTLSFGQTNIIMLTWTVPHLAKKDVHGWHYQYLLQKQAGVQWKLDLQVTLPECSVMNNTSGGLVTSSRRAARLTQTLNEDTSVGINYNC
jgi:hypothetical protein